MENFNKNGFMEYMRETFSGMGNAMLRGTIDNIIEYGLREYNNSLDQFCYFVSDLIDDVCFAEVVMFMDDSELTEYSRKLKAEAIKEWEERKHYEV